MKGEAVSLFATRFFFQSTNLAIGINGKLKAFYLTYKEAWGLISSHSNNRRILLRSELLLTHTKPHKQTCVGKSDRQTTYYILRTSHQKLSQTPLKFNAIYQTTTIQYTSSKVCG